jgi:predicted phage terminase large subunit-like protein
MVKMSLLSVSREEAFKDVTQIMLAKDYLVHFSEYMSTDEDGMNWYTAYKMHQMMAHELEQVLLYLMTGGKQGTQFLLILMPPQHGKSTMVSRFFPAFAFGKMPNLRVLHVSYGADLASTNSRFVRNLVLSPKYQAVFGKYSPNSDEPVLLASDSKAAAEWDLASPHRGGMIATGVGGAVPGRPKGLGIFDDPIKGEKEAQSPQIRDDAWDFYTSSFRPRMFAGVLPMTHWHPDDPAGRIVRDMVLKPNGDKWKILMLPGIIEDGMFAKDREEQRKRMAEGVYLPLRDPLGRAVGEVVCPELLPKAEMLKIRSTMGDRLFTALFQQMPYPKDGQKYKRDWFEKVTKIPDDVKVLYIVRYWDKANSKRGDYTVGVLMCYCSNQRFYILDVARIRDTSFGRDEFMKKVSAKDAETYGKVYIWHQQDPGQAGKDAAEATNRLLTGYPVFYEVVSGSKEDRSEAMESAFQGKNIFLLEAPWNDAFISECVAFTGDNKGHDDQVDAASSAYHKLLQKIGKKRKSRIL